LKIKNIIKAFLPYGFLNLNKKYLTINIFNLLRKKFKHLHVRDNSVLLIEFYSNHGEVLPGIIKYLLDLDYNVDVILSKANTTRGDGRNDPGLFACFNENDKVKIKFLSSFDTNLLLRSPVITNYKHIIFNSFYDEIECDHLYKVGLFKLKPVCMLHNADINNAYSKTNKMISLVKMDRINRESPLLVNSHYFGEFQKREKSKIATFFSLNTNDLFRRNPYLLFKACDKLYERGIYNFSVKIIGNGLSIPDNYRNNFTVFGFLDFLKMYKEITSSDFILALIDQASVKYTNKASGTYQLSYGFLKPIILHNKFSAISGFTNENSILYEDNNKLADAMEKCINMSNENYLSLVDSLEKSEKELYLYSLNNLKGVLNTSLISEN
jgi:hypothetical protein